MTSNVSIIICTRNRADSLRQTMQCFASAVIPAGLRPELLIVDNGSSDHTAEMVRQHSGGRIPIRYLSEATPGLSRARNAGMAASRGEVILFADDDVAPAMNWLEHISTPLLQRRCEAASGRVELGKELSRPWMTPQHLAWLAIFHGGLRQLIGANMGFHRSVLERVPEFDAELGAGASGFAEETLFSWQLLEAGFRLEYIPEAVVVHHPDPSRLIRSSWLSSARKHGASTAYLCHHWEHQEVRNPRMRAGCLQLKLRLRRMAQPPPPPDAEGIAAWEMSYAARLETLRQFLNERRRPRNYSKRGLRKLRPESNEQTCPSSAKVESAAGQRSIRADDPSFGTFQ